MRVPVVDAGCCAVLMHGQCVCGESCCARCAECRTAANVLRSVLVRVEKHTTCTLVTPTRAAGKQLEMLEAARDPAPRWRGGVAGDCEGTAGAEAAEDADSRDGAEPGRAGGCNNATKLREKSATVVGTFAQQLIERCIQGEMTVFGWVHVRRVRPSQLSICGHVERHEKQQLEFVLQRVKMTGKKETMNSEEASASDALLE